MLAYENKFILHQKYITRTNNYINQGWTTSNPLTYLLVFATFSNNFKQF